MAIRFLWGFPAILIFAAQLPAACCYFSAKQKDVLQPAQKVFITWDPQRGIESFTVQPRFTGNAANFGMVIPTPAPPKLHEMPRDFFKSLAVFTIMKQRQTPQSNLLWQAQAAGWPNQFGGGFGQLGGGFGALGGGFGALGGGNLGGGFGGMGMFGGMGGPMPRPRPPAVKVLETGVVGSLDYKIIKAGRADDLFKWLKDNNYHYGGDEATLDFYIQKKWYFTVMKIDTLQMKRGRDGRYIGEVTPTRFAFYTKRLIYPLKITQLSVKDKTEALFYISAPWKVDLMGPLSYQYQWTSLLESAQGCTSGSLPGDGSEWLKTIRAELPKLRNSAQKLNFAFVSGQRPTPNKKGRTPTTIEWAKRLTQNDISVLQQRAYYSEPVPNPDFGFTVRDLRNQARARAIYNVIKSRLDAYQKLRPNGFLVREAPRREIAKLRILQGHLQAAQFITKFRKVFTREEMNDDLILGRAQIFNHKDESEYEEMLPTSPP